MLRKFPRTFNWTRHAASGFRSFHHGTGYSRPHSSLVYHEGFALPPATDQWR